MYIIMTSSASMPASCCGNYRNVAIVELTPEFAGIPARIDIRAKGVKRIVSKQAYSVGKTERGAYQRALAEAERHVAELNAPKDIRKDIEGALKAKFPGMNIEVI